MNRALVIGAGIAGITTAVALSRLGFHVTICDKASALCTGASGNPAGSVSPFPGSPQDPLTRYYAAAYAYALSFYAAFPADIAARTGALNILPRTMAQPERLAGIPNAEIVTVEDIRQRFPGVRADNGGVFFPDALTVRPKEICAHLCAAHDIEMRFNTDIISITITSHGIEAADARGAVLSADAAVACNAYGARMFAGDIPLLPVKGQISCYRPEILPHPGGYSVHGGGYAARVPGESLALIGATFEKDVNNTIVTAEADTDNMSRISAFLPATDRSATPVFSRASVRAALPDRRATVGRIPGKSRCYINAGHGSRGLISAPFAACIMANMIAEDAGLPLPFTIDDSIIAVVSPARFAERAARKKRPRSWAHAG